MDRTQRLWNVKLRLTVFSIASSTLTSSRFQGQVEIAKKYENNYIDAHIYILTTYSLEYTQSDLQLYIQTHNNIFGLNCINSDV